MNYVDVEQAADKIGVGSGLLCVALGHALPVIEELVSKLPWYARWAGKKLVNALADYRVVHCGGA